ncbi:MAG TPA: FIST N-terminal domain-containing protein [Solirubrobacteraceae bacterium]|nr:FIST N-terminal domain-containing protein [Solirubrobacteraceae bacterium]
MSVAIGASVSTLADPFAAGAEAAASIRDALGHAQPDLAVVFASGGHLSAPEALLEGIHDTLEPAALVGCGAGGVLGGGRELESGTAVAAWAASFGGAGHAQAFHAQLSGDDVDGEIDDLPSAAHATGTVLLTDPYSFPADAALASLAADAPAVPVLGGIASARTPQGSAALFLGEEVWETGAVGVHFDGVELLPCVSQGAAPFGRELTITAAEGNVITELAGRPALQTIESVIGELTPRERTLVAGGLLIGIVIDTGRPDYEQGDFLVRGVLGADRDTGAVAVGATVHAGQIVRLHARDARSADEDLRRSLALRVGALAGRSPAGALVFSCNGRGRQMFGTADHDAGAVMRELGGAPSAGFFAAGEIGPVGGRSFLHGFTATVAVFPS